MGKLIDKFSPAGVLSIKQLNPETENWERRKKWADCLGTLTIMESEHKHPGEYFAIMETGEGERCFKTSCGQLAFNRERSMLRLTTENSEYIFLLSTEADPSDKDFVPYRPNR